MAGRPAVALEHEELRRLLHASPLHRQLGVELTESQLGRVRVWLPYRDTLLADDRGNQVHRGVCVLLADTAAAFAFATVIGEAVSPIDMRVDFVGIPKRGHDLLATGTVERREGRLGRAAAVVCDDAGRDLLVARCLCSLLG